MIKGPDFRTIQRPLESGIWLAAASTREVSYRRLNVEIHGLVLCQPAITTPGSVNNHAIAHNSVLADLLCSPAIRHRAHLLW